MNKGLFIGFLAGITLTGSTLFAIGKTVPDLFTRSLIKVNILQDNKISEEQINNSKLKIEDSNKSFLMNTSESVIRIEGVPATTKLGVAIGINLFKHNIKEAEKLISVASPHEAFESLINGRANIILIPEPREKEIDFAKDKKVDLEIIPIMKDAFVFFVNKENTIKTLTKEQIRNIYQGKIKNWKAVGGEDSEIEAFQRPSNSTIQFQMENMVMSGLQIMAAPREHFIESGVEEIDRVAGFNNSNSALGYSYFYYGKAMFNKANIRLIDIDNIAAQNYSIKDGTYPFTYKYYAIFKKSELPDSSTRKVVDFLTGQDGEKIIQEAGFTPLSK